MTALYIFLSCFAGIAIGYLGRWMWAKFKLSSVEQKAVRLDREAVAEAESHAREIELEARDRILREKEQNEREARERRSELQKSERRLLQKEENLEHKQNELDAIKKQLGERSEAIGAKEKELVEKEAGLITELEKIAGMSQEEAKSVIIQEMQQKARHDGQVYINKIEAETKLSADKVARDIIIDDTPEAVVISWVDPVRKEIARVALERLVQDGRIHPARIEEMVNKVSREVGRIIVDEGEKVAFDLGIHNMPSELIRALGRLYFRTSYGQNVLYHSKEVAILAGMIASEVGANSEIAMRGGLLHDIGKGAETESEANHAEMGADLVKRLGEDPRVVNAVHAHHGDVEPSCLESIIVQIADAISAARPGARRESLDNYIKRLENLEGIAKSFDGVDNAFAIQAGRELRIMVNNTKVSDEDAKQIAKGIAERIEAELRYPGKIKVTIIRETRVVEYAK